MGLKDTISLMRQQLKELSEDLEKSCRGYKAAAVRVRTGTVRFAKLAKIYRKESVAEEKKAYKE
ncbi:MAG: hypothetical protein JSS61_06575 [Verrucomicrobia bacterium]|nr:hypothetical protein [Verrucomicrobiota bacterium]